MNEPGVIIKLDESVVNRIAAGEVIQRPANALKELLENSLDAKSTNIQVTVKNGGLKLLQIQDNGTGIRKDDLPILCERFTTSKLREFEDLNNISTFGFRGEALASISYVAHLTVTTKTLKEKCAFKAAYEDGKLTGPPKPCAGNQGTLIAVEDLFYNVSTRRNAVANVSEEFAKIVEVVSRYAIHNPKVGFSLKKHGDVTMSVKTNQSSSHIDNIRSVFGDKLAKDLVEVSETDDTLKFKLYGFISNANYSAKKQVLILFINDRLVGSSALKKSLEYMYARYLPKNEHAFAYLSLSIDPRNVDVNVHPTKHEVHFLHEDSIIEKTIKAIESQLLGANDSRIFYTQAKLPGINLEIENAVLEKSIESKSEPKIAPKSTIRVDSTVQKIDRFLSSIPDPQKEGAAESKKSSYQRRDIKLTSVLTLRKEVEASCYLAVRELISGSSFIGCIDGDRCLSQNGSTLYLMNVRTLKEELIFQLMLYEFGNFGAIRLQEPVPLFELALLGLEDPVAGWQEEDGSKSAIAESVVELLDNKKEMLLDYFSIEIDDGELLSIPLLLDDYHPDMSRLPYFILRLACDVEWSAELPCFKSICRETAKFYAYTNVYGDQVNGDKDWTWITEHVVFPAIKKSLLPPKAFVEDQTIVQLTTTEQLYKIFERC